MNKTIPLKSPAEIQLMSEGGYHLGNIVNTLALHAEPGVTAQDLEVLANDMIKRIGGEPSFRGFHGYPAATCISVNDEIVHGLPGKRVLKEGDLVGIDVGLRYKGFCTDAAVTVAVGKISQAAQKLLDVTSEALFLGIEQVKPGNHIGDISSTIQTYVTQAGFGVVRDLTGHGIGRQPHEEPPVPNFGEPGTGPRLTEGMALAIEPMVTAGEPAVKQLSDGWTVVTVDRSLAAHFEHTVVVTKSGYQILTQSWPKE